VPRVLRLQNGKGHAGENLGLFFRPLFFLCIFPLPNNMRVWAVAFVVVAGETRGTGMSSGMRRPLLARIKLFLP